MTAVSFFNDQPHLQPPITQMNVADHFIAVIAVDTLQALADDGSAQVADMKRLRHVGAAVVDDNLLILTDRVTAKILRLRHLRKVRSKVSGIQLQI